MSVQVLLLTFSEFDGFVLGLGYVGADVAVATLLGGELDFLVPNVLAVPLLWFSKRSSSSFPGINPS